MSTWDDSPLGGEAQHHSVRLERRRHQERKARRREPLARLDASLRKLWRHWLGHVVWAVSALVALSQADWAEPRRTLPAVVLGALGGLRAGKVWRDRLRADRDEAHATVDRWNQADNNYALDEVGALTPERRQLSRFGDSRKAGEVRL